MTTAQNIVGADRQDEHRARHIAGADRVHEFRLRDRIEQDLGKGGQLHAHGLRIELSADGVEHPAVGDQDPERGKIAAESDEPGRGQMLHLGEAVPSKEEQPIEGGLEKEGDDALDCERRAEDVAANANSSSVRAELELNRDAGRDAHREIDAKKRAPELRRIAPDGASGHRIDRSP